jgi:hypothetical protein
MRISVGAAGYLIGRRFRKEELFFSTCNEMLSQSSLVSAYWMRDIIHLEHDSSLACYKPCNPKCVNASCYECTSYTPLWRSASVLAEL